MLEDVRKRVFREFKRTWDKKIDESEFVNRMLEVNMGASTGVDLHAEFRKIDRDGNGFIDHAELSIQ